MLSFVSFVYMEKEINGDTFKVYSSIYIYANSNFACAFRNTVNPSFSIDVHPSTLILYS